METRTGPADATFALRVAVINTLLFCLPVIGDSYLHKQLKSLHLFGARVYPYGYPSAAAGILIFVGTYVVLRRARGWHLLAWPLLLTLLVGFTVSLTCFGPPWPNLGQLQILALYAMPGPVTVYVRFWLRDEIPDAEEIPATAVIEWVREHAAFWRSAAIGGIIALIGLWPPLMELIARNNDLLLTDAWERYRADQVEGSQMFCFAATIVFGPIAECLYRARCAPALLRHAHGAGGAERTIGPG